MPVYFIQAGVYGPIKIGFAADPDDRRATLQTGHYQELRIVALMPGDEADERRLHAQFEADRIRGEWFAMNAGIASLIETFKCAQPTIIVEPEIEGAIRTIDALAKAVGSQARLGRLLGMSPQSISNSKIAGNLPRREAVRHRRALAAAGFDVDWSVWGIDLDAEDAA